MEETIADWQTRRRGATNIKTALDLADSFSEACLEGKPLPSWAFALRALAGGYRRAKEVADAAGGEHLEYEVDNTRLGRG